MGKENKKLSRRSFISAAGLTALGTAGLFGCSNKNEDNQDNSDTAEKSDDQAAAVGKGEVGDVRWSWEVAPDPIDDADIVETYDCDICVLGAGATGVPAALSAADSGAKTIVLQKGEGAITNGWCVCQFNSKRVKDVEPEIDMPALYAKFAEETDGRDNGRVVRMWMERSGEVLDYLLDLVPGNEPVLYEYGNEHWYAFGWYKDNDFSTRYIGYKEVIDAMLEKSQELGAEYLWNTPAVQLVQNDEGDVTGVIGKNENDEYIKVNASKGVIMATGDICDDEELIECYAPFAVGVPNVKGAPVNNGDGHKMGLWAGASIDSSPHSIMIHFDPTWQETGNAPFSGNPWLRVNKNGERFANENLAYHSVVISVVLQPEQTAYQIIDNTWDEHCNEYYEENTHSRYSPDPQHDWQDALDRGAIVSADTIEELAEKIDVPVDNLVATVNRYNELVDKGVDEDFGVRSDYFAWNGIKEPPFYAIKRVPGLLATAGGLTINEKLEVLNTEGEPIKGLYAGGDASGSFYGDWYPLLFTGGSLSRAMVFGALASKSALGTMDEKLA